LIPIRDYNPSGTVPLFTMLLIVANGVVFAWQMKQPPERMETYFRTEGALVPARVQYAFSRGSREEKTGAFASVFTSLFLHGGLLHLLLNMWFLWIFGDNVEDRFGHFLFLLFYIACGVGAAGAHLITHWGSPVPCVGASGAISGVMGAYLISFPKARIQTLIPLFGLLPVFVLVPAGFFLVVWFVGQFYIPGPSVAWQAHVGGFIVGFVLTLVLPKRKGFRVRWRRQIVR